MKDEIKTHYVDFNTAKLLKEKGFDIPVNHYYFEDGEFKEHSLTGTNGYYGEEYEFELSEFNVNWNDSFLTKKNGDRCFGCSKNTGYFETFSAPEQWKVVEWLRINHGIWVTVDIGKEYWFWKIRGINGKVIVKEQIPDELCTTLTGLLFSNTKYLKYISPQEAYSAAFDYILNNNLT